MLLDLGNIREQTAFHLGMLNQVCCATPLLAGMNWREAIKIAHIHATTDGAQLDLMQLYAALNGINLMTMGTKRNFGAVQKALKMHDLLTMPISGAQKEYVHFEKILTRDVVIGHIKGKKPQGLKDLAQYLWDVMRKDEIDPAPELECVRAAVPFLLFNDFKSPPLPLCGSSGFANEHITFNEFYMSWLQALTSEAKKMLEHHDKLLRQWKFVRKNIPGQRRGDTIRNTVDIVAMCGLISPIRLSNTLTISQRRAGVILEELCDLGILIEVTKRKTHKLYGLMEFKELSQRSRGPRHTQRFTLGKNAQNSVQEMKLKPPSLSYIVDNPENDRISDDYLQSLFFELDAANKKATIAILNHKKV